MILTMDMALVSDIRSNLIVLEAVLNDILTNIDVVVCVSDIIGYSASPVS